MEKLNLLTFYITAYRLQRYIIDLRAAGNNEMEAIHLSERLKDLKIERANIQRLLDVFRLRDMPGVVTQISRFYDPVDTLVVTKLLAQAEELESALRQELSRVSAVVLRTDLTEVRLRLKETCHSQLENAIPDAEQASNCYGIGNWDGCVFHLARVAEHGLRKLAERLKVSFALDGSLELKTWGAVIKKMEIIVQELKSQTVPEKEFKAACLDALAQLRAIQHTWRDVVFHSRNPSISEMEIQGLWFQVLNLIRNIQHIV